MGKVIETITVKSRYGGCPECGDCGELMLDAEGLDWLVCHEHGLRWFLGYGYSHPGCDKEPALLECYVECQPLAEGERMRLAHECEETEVTKLSFRDGTTLTLLDLTVPRKSA